MYFQNNLKEFKRIYFLFLATPAISSVAYEFAS